MRRHTSAILGIGLFLLMGTAALAQVPAAPSNLTATPISDDQARLTWQDNSNNETAFVLEARTPITAYQELSPTIPANATTAIVFNLEPGTTYFFRLKARNASGDSLYSNEAFVTTFDFDCTQNATTMCLNNGRFQVRATFQTSGGDSGSAQAVRLTEDSGYFTFFTASNVELIVKVLNGCSLNNRYWVFAAGLTNVQVTITVTDTKTGTVKTYNNPLNRAFPPIQDTSAFATCP